MFDEVHGAVVIEDDDRRVGVVCQGRAVIIHDVVALQVEAQSAVDRGDAADGERPLLRGRR